MLRGGQVVGNHMEQSLIPRRLTKASQNAGERSNKERVTASGTKQRHKEATKNDCSELFTWQIQYFAMSKVQGVNEHGEVDEVMRISWW